MPRPRRLHAVRPYRTDHADRDLPEVLRSLLAAEDPALTYIAARLEARRAAGDNVLDATVAQECIAAGRLDHALAAVGESA